MQDGNSVLGSGAEQPFAGDALQRGKTRPCCFLWLCQPALKSADSDPQWASQREREVWAAKD